MIVSLLPTKQLFKSKLFDWKVPKIDDVIRLSSNHVFHLTIDISII